MTDLGWKMKQAGIVNRAMYRKDITLEERERWLIELKRPVGFWENLIHWLQARSPRK